LYQISNKKSTIFRQKYQLETFLQKINKNTSNFKLYQAMFVLRYIYFGE